MMTRNTDDYRVEPTRDLYLFGEINEESVLPLIEQIHNINIYDHEMINTYVNYNPEIIKLHITSQGGDVYSGFSLVSAIEQSETPVWAEVDGLCASMAFIVFLSADIRFIHRHATLMYHGISAGLFGTIKDMEIDMDQMKYLQTVGDEFVCERTGLDSSFIKEKTKNDWYIGPSTAVELGIAHGIFPMSDEQINQLFIDMAENEKKKITKENKTKKGCTR